MKVICERQALLSAVNNVASVVPTRTPTPALACLKLVATKTAGVSELVLAGRQPVDGEAALFVSDVSERMIERQQMRLHPRLEVRFHSNRKRLGLCEWGDLESILPQYRHIHCAVSHSDQTEIRGFRMTVFEHDRPTNSHNDRWVGEWLE